MSKQVTLTIDGKQITVPDGIVVADAAKMVGSISPSFVIIQTRAGWHVSHVSRGDWSSERDRATGQFVMENGAPKIQFMPKLETACTNKVEDGMVILTQSAKATDGQKGTVEFLLTSHPLDCPICDKGGECPLQNLTMAYGPGKSRFIYNEKLHLDRWFRWVIDLFGSRTLYSCARCIRFQDEIAGDSVIGFDARARSTQIVSLSDPGFDFGFLGQYL